MSIYRLDDFDFVNVMIYDVHGVPRGIMMARRRMDDVVKRGLGIYGGVCYFGIKDQPIVHEDFAEKNDFGNNYLKPVLDTLQPVPVSKQAKYKVGQVLSNVEFLDGQLDTSIPRTAAEIQLKKLQTELGLTFKSAVEMEFNIKHANSDKYLGHMSKWACPSVLNNCQDVLLDMIKELSEVGVHVDSMQTECGPGQFEFTLDIGEGLETPDKVLHFKNFVKTFMKSRDLEASFMTSGDPCKGCSNGFHFNHSLWTADGKNALLDVSQPNKLSKLGQHWMAGLIEHAPALVALSNPTMNCYRRIGGPWAPTYANWGAQNRLATYRLKVEQGDNIYIENRLPSSASNPYLVLAGVIAAGMDGVKRKLSLPKPLDQSSLLPKDLETAIGKLQEDIVMTSELGNLVKYFTFTKRAFEIDVMKKLESLTDEQRLEKEREIYFHNA